METTVNNNKRIAKNTLLLYFRMLFILALSLFTSRIILQALGVSDYGLYNVTGGFVSILGFLNVTLASGTQRFLSFAIGQGDQNKLKSVFRNALTIHGGIALITILLAETIGLWFVTNKLNIPEGRETAAFWVYQFSVLAFAISNIQVPFMSSLIAHENMRVYAYMSILDAVLKLLIAYSIQFASYDRLIIYAGLFLCVQVIDVIIYMTYCHSKYKECSIKPWFEKSLFREMTNFSIWTIIGTLGFTTNHQGINILLNLFFGTTVNAARGLSAQVNGMVQGFASNFQTASNPQIIKYYAEDNLPEMIRLAIRTSRVSGYLLIFIIVPLYIEAEKVLAIWLGSFPDSTPVFLRIVLIQSLVTSIGNPIVTVTHACGKLKMPNLTGGMVVLLAIPLYYLLFTLGLQATTILIINIFVYLIETFFNCFFANRYTGFPIKDFYMEVYSRVALIFTASFIPSRIVSLFISIHNDLFHIVTVTIISCTLSGIMIYLFGLNQSEKKSLIRILSGKLKKHS